MVFSSGLFVNVMNKFKVLIPINYLENYLFENNYFINSINKNTIKEGDKVKFEITGIKYSKKQFNCGYFILLDPFKYLHITHAQRFINLNEFHEQSIKDIKNIYIDIIEDFNLKNSPKWLQ
jgi:DNA-directed RNA polymerase subunit E'/Rpb7